jgi:predicted unusual protein kinase regulating ubiquinone biosynthesis (AarF/ABC1/UbiB family)
MVAVKVLRPGVRERFATDIGAMLFAARWPNDYPRGAAPAPGRFDPRFRACRGDGDRPRLEASALSELRENSREG